MQDSFVDTILPQLATGSAHTSALGFVFDGLHEGDPRIRVPWRPDLVGDPGTGVLAGGLDLNHMAMQGLFDRETLVAHLLGRDRIYSVRYGSLLA